MATRTVFEDNNGNEMDCYINDQGLIYISVGPRNEDHAYNWGYITLNRNDVQELMKVLKEAEPNLVEEHPPVETA